METFPLLVAVLQVKCWSHSWMFSKSSEVTFFEFSFPFRKRDREEGQVDRGAEEFFIDYDFADETI